MTPCPTKLFDLAAIPSGYRPRGARDISWLEIARLAWNIGKWIALLALPEETIRWEWKRFRQAFVYVAAQVLRRSRQVTLRISASHRWHRILVAAHQRLQT